MEERSEDLRSKEELNMKRKLADADRAKYVPMNPLRSTS